jgi:DNA-binding SARP family transcriptional activator
MVMTTGELVRIEKGTGRTAPAPADDLIVKLLGPLELASDDDAGRIMPRTGSLLAALALQANQPVSTEHLSAWLWTEDQYPRSPAGAIQTYVSRLRQTLHTGVDVVTLPNAYLLRIDPEAVDALRFERLVQRTTAEADSEPLLHDALALWRGPALCDIPRTDLVAAQCSRLTELHLQVLETHYDLRIRRGENTQLVNELRKLTAEHPFRERLFGHLMTCLAAVGLRAEALETYQEVYRRFRDELGVQPGAELRALHHRLLTTDEAVPAPTARETVTARTGPAPQIPRQSRETPATGGRGLLDTVAAQLESATGAPRALVLTGPPGVGTTTLAIRYARMTRAQYPSGVFFVDTAVCAPADDIGSRERWGADSLVIVDGVTSVHQARQWLVHCAGHVLLTSSRRLHGLPDAATVRVPTPSVRRASAILGGLLGVAAGSPAERLLPEIARLCDCSPLALQTVAANLKNSTYSGLSAAVDALSVPPSDRVLELSCGELDILASYERAIRACSAHQRTVLLHLADQGREQTLERDIRAVSGSVPPAALRLAVRGLVDANLLSVTRPASRDGICFRLSPLCAGSVEVLEHPRVAA